MLNASIISKTNSTDTIQKKWEWSPCVFDLKKETKKKIEYFNMGPQASFFLNEQEISVMISIKMDKELDYSESMGSWLWHKSWNLPFFKVSIDFINPNTGEHYETPKNLFVEILAVKPFLENLRHFHLIDVGISGNNRLKINEMDCLFSSLKFSTTSYNHKEAKFHLTVSVLQKEPDKPPIYLSSVISPPIFVDSRKSARNPKDLKKRHMNAFIEYFQLDSLKKDYTKKEKKNSQIVEDQIENNLKGLFDYLTAPNIREKVKNPLFLSLKFDKCTKLYYDPNKLNMKSESNFNVLEKFFFLLKNYFLKGKTEIPRSFLLIIQFQEYSQNHHYIRKILDVYELFKGSPLEVLSELEHIPNEYKPLVFNTIEEFEKDYSQIPETLTKNLSILSDCESDFCKQEINSQNSDFFDLDNLPKKQKKNEFATNLYSKNSILEKNCDDIFENSSRCLRSEIQIFPQEKGKNSGTTTSIDFNKFFEISEINGKKDFSEKGSEEKNPSSLSIPVKKEVKIELKEENLSKNCFNLQIENKNDFLSEKQFNSAPNPFIGNSFGKYENMMLMNYQKPMVSSFNQQQNSNNLNFMSPYSNFYNAGQANFNQMRNFLMNTTNPYMFSGQQQNPMINPSYPNNNLSQQFFFNMKR